MLPTAFKTRKTSGHTFPNALQVKDAYAQYTPTFPSYTSVSASASASASGSNNIPISTSQEIEIRREKLAATPLEIQARRERLLAPGVYRGGRGGRAGGISRYHGTLYKNVGGFKVPIPPAPAIEGRVLDENKESADLLKMMMEDDMVMDVERKTDFEMSNMEGHAQSDDSDECPTSDPISIDTPTTPNSESGAGEMHNDPLLVEAFRNEYYGSHHSLNSRFGALVSVSSGAHPWLLLPELAEVHDERMKARPTPLVLPGIDPQRNRNRYGRGLAPGQESGVGVIGSEFQQVVPDDDPTKVYQVINGPNGCDTPVYRFDDAHVKSGKCDPDLPPLAVEHPARVWNSLIHALDPEQQPIVKWTYEKATMENDEQGWSASLALGLPPAHPIIVGHALPKSLRAKEYLAAIKPLGGVRTWSGEPRKLKADAVNVTLAKAMEEGAISWIHSPAVQDAMQISG